MAKGTAVPAVKLFASDRAFCVSYFWHVWVSISIGPNYSRKLHEFIQDNSRRLLEYSRKYIKVNGINPCKIVSKTSMLFVSFGWR